MVEFGIVAKSVMIMAAMFLAACVTAPSAEPIVLEDKPPTMEEFKVRECVSGPPIKGEDNQLRRPLLVSVEEFDDLDRWAARLRKDTSLWFNGEVKDENIEQLLRTARRFKNGPRIKPERVSWEGVVGYVFVYLPSGPAPKECVFFVYKRSGWEQMKGKTFVQVKYRGTWIIPVEVATAQPAGEFD